MSFKLSRWDLSVLQSCLIKKASADAIALDTELQISRVAASIVKTAIAGFLIKDKGFLTSELGKAELNKPESRKKDIGGNRKIKIEEAITDVAVCTLQRIQDAGSPIQAGELAVQMNVKYLTMNARIQKLFYRKFVRRTGTGLGGYAYSITDRGSSVLKNNGKDESIARVNSVFQLGKFL